MQHPHKILANKILEKGNDKKTLIALGIVFALVIGFFTFLVVSHHKNAGVNTQTKKKASKIEPFEKISEFTQSATGEAISDLQTNASLQSQQITSLKDENKKLNKSLQDIHDGVVPAKSQSIVPNLEKPLSIAPQDNAAPLSNNAYLAPHVINASQNLNALPRQSNTPISLNSNNKSLGGIADFSFSYESQQTEAQDPNECTPDNCILPGTFVRAVMIGAADANASVNGQSNTTPIVFDILDRGTLPNNYHSHLKGCYVVGEAYGDVSSSRGEVKLSQISCILNGKPISKTINGTAYYLGKEGIYGNTITKNGSMLWNAGVSGMLGGLAQGVGQAQQTQSMSPLGTTSSIAPNRIAMSMGTGGVEAAANTLANYYIKRADQYHSVVELNSGTIVDLVFMNKFLLTPDSDQSKGALATVQPSNNFWKHGADKSNAVTPNSDTSNLSYDSPVNSNQASEIQNQINSAGQNNDEN